MDDRYARFDRFADIDRCKWDSALQPVCLAPPRGDRVTQTMRHFVGGKEELFRRHPTHGSGCWSHLIGMRFNQVFGFQDTIYGSAGALNNGVPGCRGCSKGDKVMDVAPIIGITAFSLASRRTKARRTRGQPSRSPPVCPFLNKKLRIAPPRVIEATEFPVASVIIKHSLL